MAFIDHVPQGFRGLPILSPESQARRDIVDTARAIGYILTHPAESRVKAIPPEGGALERCYDLLASTGHAAEFAEIFGHSVNLEHLPSVNEQLGSLAINVQVNNATQPLPELPQ